MEQETREVLEAIFGEKTLETARNLRLIDDALFRLVGSDAKVCQEILRTLLDDDELIVLQAKPQETIINTGREIVLDVLCRLGNGRIVNIEVQKGNNNHNIKRCRYHLSLITSGKTPKGTTFKDIPDVTIVYITEYDALGNGQAVTCSEMCQLLDEKYIPVHDGAKVYYANTTVRDNTDKSELLSLFLKQDSFENSKFPNLSEAVKYFKEDGKGVGEVCTIVEEYAKDYAEEYAKEYAKEYVKDQAKEFALYLIEQGKDTNEIAQVTHLTEEEVESLRA